MKKRDILGIYRISIGIYRNMQDFNWNIQDIYRISIGTYRDDIGFQLEYIGIVYDSNWNI